MNPHFHHDLVPKLAAGGRHPFANSIGLFLHGFSKYCMSRWQRANARPFFFHEPW
jgi:hypothetical protein